MYAFFGDGDRCDGGCRIRASISQFQQELIGHVREAVSTLQDKFRHRYEVSFRQTPITPKEEHTKEAYCSHARVVSGRQAGRHSEVR